MLENLKKELIFEAQSLKNNYPNLNIGDNNNDIKRIYLDQQIYFVISPKQINSTDSVEITERDNKRYLEVIIPYSKTSDLVFLRSMDRFEYIRDIVFYTILFSNIAVFIAMVVASFIISSKISIYLKKITEKLAKTDDRILECVEVDELPEELKPLGESINSMFDKLKKYLSYQKELFIGIAHELKTPLAVMKLKNEVALIKKRDSEKYIETLKTNIISIDEMNNMISSVLNIGRQEGAVFEKSEYFDVNKFMRKIVENFELLAAKEGKRIVSNIDSGEFYISIQPTLLNQIVQNFLQNGLKFTQPQGQVIVKTYLEGQFICIDVIDEGSGIDGNIDIYAPFRRSGNKSGAGLGLFLAKSAAESINAQIDIKNRDDGKSGAIASVKIKV